MQIPRGARFRFGGKCAPNKYGNEPVEVDNIRFDSKKEAARYQLLKLRLKAGEIRDLRWQVPYPILVEGRKLCDYYADFVYFDVKSGEVVVEDVKSDTTARTAAYRLKKKGVLLQHGVRIREV